MSSSASLQLLAAIGPHVAEVVERSTVLGIDRERALESVLRLGMAPQSLVGDAEREHQVEVPRASLGCIRGIDRAPQDGDHVLEAGALLVVLHQQQHRLPVVGGGELIEDLPGLLVAAERFEHLGLLDLVAVALEIAGAREQLLLRLQHLERFARLPGLGQAVGEQEHDLAPQPLLDVLAIGFEQPLEDRDHPRLVLVLEVELRQREQRGRIGMLGELGEQLVGLTLVAGRDQDLGALEP